MGDNLLSDNRPAIYREEEKVIVRFSGAGMCQTALALHLTGQEPAPPPDWMLKKFEEGHNAEPIIIKAIEVGIAVPNAKFKMLDGGDSQNWFQHVSGFAFGQFECEIPLTSTIWARGKLDGLAECYVYPNALSFMAGKSVVECKAFGPYYWEKFKKSGLDGIPHYKPQVSLQMHATALPCLFVVGEKDEDGALTGEYAYQYVEEAPISLGEIRARMAKTVALAGTLEAGGERPECDPKSFPCPFFYLHDDEEEVKEGMPETVHTTIEADVVSAYLDAKKKVAEAKRIEATLKAQLMDMFGDVERGVAEIGEYRVLKSPVHKREYTVKASVWYKLEIKGG